MGRLAELNEVARALVAPGKGILAADESSGTIKKRFDSIGVESTEDNRRDYREMLFRTEGAADHISGVILFDETIRQKAADGTPLVELLEKQGIIPGIKVDAGAKPLAFSEGETVTEGLDGLRERLAEYRDLGAKFAKWRATYSIDTASKGGRRPTDYCIDVNAHALARYAALCQEAGIVPIVEPEVLMDGDHTIDESFHVTDARARARCSHQLFDQSVDVRGHAAEAQHGAVGLRQRRAGVGRARWPTTPCGASASRCPPRCPASCSCPGGQSDELATAHLNAMNKLGPHPWQLSFSYGRALQAPALQGVERQGRQRRRRPGRVPQARPPQRCGARRVLHRSDGAGELTLVRHTRRNSPYTNSCTTPAGVVW